ncbi:hypothetical protein ILP92_11405 [Maribius pontilimi]|uniref:Uncharacterized protein n=1 Tax=Palleronia pontilimi TaxID=1964209 RepID=A0A934MA87_9RHOB|nr:hypothetical protein [Palleronia pontilimi]MBJ3763352.1 hypothetical protein [Palleronia pontilimi]
MQLIFAIAISFPTITTGQALTPEDLRAQIDAQTAQSDPFMDILNDPDSARSLAAVELMINSGDPRLMQMAIDFGLQSAAPPVRRAAVLGFLHTRPVLQVQVKLPEDRADELREGFRKGTGGSVLANGDAVYSVNVGDFDAENNCFVQKAGRRIACAVEVSPTGLTISAYSDYGAKSILNFNADGHLTGATSIDWVDGSFPTTLSITD